MQNVQNVAEIQQRVINLVELYRTKVSKESDTAKKLAAEYREQYEREIDFAASFYNKTGMDGYVIDIDIPKEDVDAIRANEQLLGYFYKNLAGKEADANVLDLLLADKYDPTIFSPEEEAFLENHFKEMVNYIIQTPNNDLTAVEEDDRNDLYLLPTEVLTLIKEHFYIPSGSKIYNPFTGLAQLACLYQDCTYLFEESYMSYFKMWNAYCDRIRETMHIIRNKVDENKLYAWMKIALYANGLDSFVIEDGSIPENFDVLMSFIPYIPSKIPNYEDYYSNDNSSYTDIINKMISSYQNLSNDGKMILILPTKYCWEKRVLASVEGVSYKLEFEVLWKQLIADNSLAEIIQLPSIMGKNLNDEEGYCVVIAEKGKKDKDVTLIDARFATIKSENKLFNKALDIDSLHAMIENAGEETNTGLRKLVQIPIAEIKYDLLTPQFYVVEKPAEYESPVPLTELCSLLSSRIYNVQHNLPEDTPWVKSADLSEHFRGALDVMSLEKADCPNNPDGWSYGNEKLYNSLFSPKEYSDKDIRISHYRNCKYLDGKRDAILFKISKDGISFTVLQATGKGIAISPNIHVLLPNSKIDVLALTALLRTPVVFRQIETYEKFGLYGSNGHLKDVLVPTNKRIIGDERHRILLEQKTLKEQENKLADQKTEYINEVRMRKHDMGQYIFELVNIEDLMRYYIENRDTEKEFCQEIEKLLDNFRSSLGELSILLDNLSKEEQFGKPETFDINAFLSSLEKRHKAEGFIIEYEPNKDSFYRYNKKNCVDVPDEYGNLNIEDTGDDRNLYVEDTGDNRDLCVEDTGDDRNLYVEDTGDNRDLCIEVTGDDRNLYVEDTGDNRDLCVEDTGDDRNLCLEDIGDYLDLSIEDTGDDRDLAVKMANADTNLNCDDIFNIGKNKPFCDIIPPLYVAPNDIKRAVNNIIDNARRHGFTDHSRKDYEVKVRLSIDNETNMFLIDFLNNGTPLPVGMNKMRYGLKGEKAGKTGGTGIGGNYVKSFVEHYHGDYDIFTENGWTVVRIFLPIK